MVKRNVRALIFRGPWLGLVVGAVLILVAAVLLALTNSNRPADAASAGSSPAAASDPAPGDASADAPDSASASPGNPASASPSDSAGASASPSAKATATTDPSAALTAAVKDLVGDDEGHVSVAVQDLSTGTTVSDNVSDDYVTASIVKLDILETLLYRDQKDGDSPGSEQRGLITAMMDQSDNAAASELYDDAGGSDGITAANKVFGLTDTEIDNRAFGDTTTTVTDQIRLLRQVFTGNSVLTSANRSYVRQLMGSVEPDQRWGVSAAADDAGSSADDYALKNGWLPRSATNLWEINSIGEVEHDGHEYLVAVLSRDNESMDSGVAVIEKVAKAAVGSQG